MDTQVLEEIPKHRLSRTIYGDEASMRDKPQWTRQAVISEQVRARLTEYDELNDVISLVITPGYVGDYDVAVVLQVLGASLRALPELRGRGWKDEEYDLSFIRSCLAQVLSVARRELLLPDPGRSIDGDMPSASEVILLFHAGSGFSG